MSDRRATLTQSVLSGLQSAVGMWSRALDPLGEHITWTHHRRNRQSGEGFAETALAVRRGLSIWEGANMQSRSGSKADMQGRSGGELDTHRKASGAPVVRRVPGGNSKAGGALGETHLCRTAWSETHRWRSARREAHIWLSARSEIPIWRRAGKECGFHDG